MNMKADLTGDEANIALKNRVQPTGKKSYNACHMFPEEMGASQVVRAPATYCKP
jgi:hypothetical protein